VALFPNELELGLTLHLDVELLFFLLLFRRPLLPGTGNSRVSVDASHLRPDRAHQEERPPTQPEVDERNQRDFVVGRAFTAVTAASVNTSHESAPLENLF